MVVTRTPKRRETLLVNIVQFEIIVFRFYLHNKGKNFNCQNKLTKTLNKNLQFAAIMISNIRLILSKYSFIVLSP